jgi:hypothetical protein
MSKIIWWLVMASSGIVALIIILFLLPVRLSSARDFGQWDRNDACTMVSSAREIPTSPDSPMPVTAKNSNALSIAFVRRFGICEIVMNVKDDPLTLR